MRASCMLLSVCDGVKSVRDGFLKTFIIKIEKRAHGDEFRGSEIKNNIIMNNQNNVQLSYSWDKVTLHSRIHIITKSILVE